MGQLEAWLRAAGLDRHAPLLAENGVEMDIVADLTEADLVELGINLGDRKRLMRAIASLSGGEETPPTITEAPPAPEAERRQLTVMFCDLADSTALSEKLDPEELRNIITDYQENCTVRIEEFGGYVAKYMGDGILAYFGYPQAHEDDPERAVHAGLTIIGAMGGRELVPGLAVHVRIGVATGPVVAGDIVGEGEAKERAVLGMTPNLAARLQSLADLDCMVISAQTRSLAGGFFDYQDLGLHELKGITEPERAWRVLGESRAASRFEVIAAGGLTPIVGRDEEIALLANRWRLAKDGEGQVVILSGEAGVGKSRIVEGFRQGLKEGEHGTIMLSCSRFRAGSALYPVIECLQRVIGFEKDDAQSVKADKLEGFVRALELKPDEIVPHLWTYLFDPADAPYPLPEGDPEEMRRKTLECLLSILLAQSSHRPMIMIAEDAHWVDPSTLEFLGLLVDRLRDMRVMLLVTARPEFQSPWGGHSQVGSVNLSRLGKSDCATMVERVAGGRRLPNEVMEQIVTKTDGVPLFVEELTKMVLESGLIVETDGGYELNGPLPSLAIPASLQDSLMARLDRLASVKEVAQTAAVIGRAFSEELLGAVSPLAPGELRGALDHLVEAELILRRGLPPSMSYEFKHGLVQEAAYESLLKSKRQAWHAATAKALEKNFPDTVREEPELLAHHLGEAGLAAEAAPYWQKAARRAAEHWASAEAVSHIRQGLELIDTLPDDGERAALEVAMLIDLVAGLRILDRYDEAPEALARAQTIAESHQRDNDLSLIHYYRGNIYFPMGNIDGCLAEHSQAREKARLAGSPEKEARALSGLGDAYYMRGAMATANAHFDDCVRLARENGLASIEAANLPMRGHTQLYMNRLEAGLKDTMNAAELAEAEGNRRAEMIARGSCGAKILFDLADHSGAKRQIGRALELSGQLGMRRFEPLYHVILAKIAALEGARSEALELARRSVETSRETGLKFSGPLTLGVLALVSDDDAQRRDALEEAMSLLAAGCVSHNYLWFYRYAMEASLEAGEFDEVERFAKAAEDYTHAEPLPWANLLIARGRALAALARDGGDGETKEVLERLRAEAREAGFKAIVPAMDAALSG